MTDKSDRGTPSVGVESELAEQIRRHRDLYYRGTPKISDAEFDALEDRLRAIAPDHPALKEVGSRPDALAPRTARVGEPAFPATLDVEAIARKLATLSSAFYAASVDAPDARLEPGQLRARAREYSDVWHDLWRVAPAHEVLSDVLVPEGEDWPKERHEIVMGSLNKVNEEDELREWALRCDEAAQRLGLEPISSNLLMTEKLDGLSLEVVYEHGAMRAAITRGDGEIGERVTPNARYMDGGLPRIKDPRRVSFRGEVVLRKSRREACLRFKERVRGAVEDMSLRNTAAGLLRANKPDLIPATKLLSVLFYDVEGLDATATELEKLEQIERLGFASPRAFVGDLKTIVDVYRRYATRERDAADYEIDGLVVRANDIRTATLLGELNRRPRAAVAFKFEHEMQISRLVDIRWQTGDTGRITPVAVVEPVRLAGATVTQASLHNAANVERLGVGIGDEVLISRRNDVIPYVEKVVMKGPNRATRPSTCVRCGSTLETEGEYLVCRNSGCPARRVGRLRSWVRQLDLDNWGDRTLDRLVELGLASEPADLYKLTTDDIAGLEGFGEVSAKKLLDPLNDKKRIPLDRFIAALGVESVSVETARLLVAAGYSSVEQIAHATDEELVKIPGLGAIKADRIRVGLQERMPEVARLLAVGVVPVVASEAGPLSGLTFCFSGTHRRPRKALESIVTQKGGRVLTTVTKGLNYLVLADAASTSSKAEKARKLGTHVISEEEFDAIVTERV